VSLGCCGGGGPFGKRPGFMAGEKVGEAREPVQALRLGKRCTMRSMETRHQAGNEGGVVSQRRTAGLSQAWPSFAAYSDGQRT